mgnify:CR=1 FL=1
MFFAQNGARKETRPASGLNPYIWCGLFGGPLSTTFLFWGAFRIPLVGPSCGPTHSACRLSIFAEGMGCAGSKEDEATIEESFKRRSQRMPPGVDSPSFKAKLSFRERRLSIGQNFHISGDESARIRRLSIYEDSKDIAGESEVTSPMPTCGCISMAGLEPVPGGFDKKINQDRGIAIYPFLGDSKQGLFGAYDGHGKAGQTISEFVVQQLPLLIENMATKLASDAPACLKETYLQVDADLAEVWPEQSTMSGTTAVTCLVQDRHIYIANAGDSRAIILRRTKNGDLTAQDLSIDQKPDTPAEKKRVLKMGGKVHEAEADGSPSRVLYGQYGLAMARSIGDHMAAKVGTTYHDHLPLTTWPRGAPGPCTACHTAHKAPARAFGCGRVDKTCMWHTCMQVCSPWHAQHSHCLSPPRLSACMHTKHAH